MRARTKVRTTFESHWSQRIELAYICINSAIAIWVRLSHAMIKIFHHALRHARQNSVVVRRIGRSCVVNGKHSDCQKWNAVRGARKAREKRKRPYYEFDWPQGQRTICYWSEFCNLKNPCIWTVFFFFHRDASMMAMRRRIRGLTQEQVKKKLAERRAGLACLIIRKTSTWLLTKSPSRFQTPTSRNTKTRWKSLAWHEIYSLYFTNIY